MSAENWERAIKNARFETSVAKVGGYLETELPQIAMVGKSNVGKSSFINAVCNNGKLARTSQSPGKTRLINYFSANNGSFYLVDLPGYGFAKAPKHEQEAWGELIEGYLRSGKVTHLFLLLDSRHPPTADDKAIFHWVLYYNIPYTLVATKVDKIAKSKRQAALLAIQKAIGAIGMPIGFSAVDKTGVREAHAQIGRVVADALERRTQTAASGTDADKKNICED